MEQAQLERISTLFKALADPARLRILGLLAEQSLSGHQIATRLRLTPPTISHHMRRLADAGLVEVTPDAQSRIYSLHDVTLRELSRSILAPDSASAEDREENDVIRAFFDGPRLRQMPASRKKRVVVLRRLLEQFEPGRAYAEPEVNAMLRMAHEDYATLRRELVDYGFLSRDKGIYRVAAELPARGATVRQEVGEENEWFAEFVANATARAMASDRADTSIRVVASPEPPLRS